MAEYAPATDLSTEIVLETGERVPRPLPFPLKVLVWFFVVDAFEKALILGATYGAGAPLADGAGFLDRYLPHLLVLAFDLLLALEIYRRTQAGRIWAMIYLAAITVLALFVLVVEPQQWMALSTGGRIRTLCSQGLHLAFFGILASRRAGRVLRR